MKPNCPKSLICGESDSKREFYRNTGLPQKAIHNLTLHLKEPEKRKRTTTKPKTSRIKELIKIKTEIVAPG